MSATETSRVCCICKKFFCCVECRKRHEKNKHPDRQLDCPFCFSRKLPLRLFEDKSLLRHIVLVHLPLYCCLCGTDFKQIKDLESFGICKWWLARGRNSHVCDPKSQPGTPPFIFQGKITESSIQINFDSLTSPPELYRNTSTPMIVGQKASFGFKTPNAPNFSIKTPKTNSEMSSQNQVSSYETATSKNNTDSNFVSFPTPNFREGSLRSLSLNGAAKSSYLQRINSGRKLEDMEEQKELEEYNDRCDDMELTNVVDNMLPDSQSILGEKIEKRSDSIKKVRFSDQYENQVENTASTGFNATENDEYFEARETISHFRESIENSAIKIDEENAKNLEKENRSPSSSNASPNEQTSASRVLMMVVVENNAALTTSDLIKTGLKKLERITSNRSSPNSSADSPGCSSSVTSVDSYYSVSSYECYSATRTVNSSEEKSVSKGNENVASGGLLSAFTHAFRSVIRNFSGATTSKVAQIEELPQMEHFPLRSIASEASAALSDITSLPRRAGKRPRDATESVSSTSRQMDLVVPQREVRSPLAKRHRGWYRIKGREPIARMRNNRVTSPRGVSLETQVFSQGSLSVGDTVLPLPARAHQSTQTEEAD